MFSIQDDFWFDLESNDKWVRIFIEWAFVNVGGRFDLKHLPHHRDSLVK